MSQAFSLIQGARESVPAPFEFSRVQPFAPLDPGKITDPYRPYPAYQEMRFIIEHACVCHCMDAEGVSLARLMFDMMGAEQAPATAFLRDKFGLKYNIDDPSLRYLRNSHGISLSSAVTRCMIATSAEKFVAAMRELAETIPLHERSLQNAQQGSYVAQAVALIHTKEFAKEFARQEKCEWFKDKKGGAFRKGEFILRFHLPLLKLELSMETGDKNPFRRLHAALQSVYQERGFEGVLEFARVFRTDFMRRDPLLGGLRIYNRTPLLIPDWTAMHEVVALTLDHLGKSGLQLVREPALPPRPVLVPPEAEARELSEALTACAVRGNLERSALQEFLLPLTTEEAKLLLPFFTVHPEYFQLYHSFRSKVSQSSFASCMIKLARSAEFERRHALVLDALENVLIADQGWKKTFFFKHGASLMLAATSEQEAVQVRDLLRDDSQQPFFDLVAASHKEKGCSAALNLLLGRQEANAGVVQLVPGVHALAPVVRKGTRRLAHEIIAELHLGKAVEHKLRPHFQNESVQQRLIELHVSIKDPRQTTRILKTFIHHLEVAGNSPALKLVLRRNRLFELYSRILTTESGAAVDCLRHFTASSKEAPSGEALFAFLKGLAGPDRR